MNPNLRTLPIPDIYTVRTHILCTYSCEFMNMKMSMKNEIFSTDVKPQSSSIVFGTALASPIYLFNNRPAAFDMETININGADTNEEYSSVLFGENRSDADARMPLGRIERPECRSFVAMLRCNRCLIASNIRIYSLNCHSSESPLSNSPPM